MAEFIYTNSLSISGPWLIDSDRLDALDKILEEEWLHLTQRNEDLLKTDVESKLGKSIEGTLSEFRERKPTNAELQSRRKEIEHSLLTFGRYKCSREITIHLRKDKKKVKVSSFKEASRQQDLLEEIPTKFEGKMECGEITCGISLAKIR
jgi:hypothetical protein